MNDATAHRLAIYRDELAVEGFTQDQVWELVRAAAPAHPHHLEISQDQKTQPVVGYVQPNPR